MTSRPDFVVVTGLSGAGRSTAADTLEDLGWFVIDNLPPSLLASAAELLTASDSSVERLALVAGFHEYQEEQAFTIAVSIQNAPCTEITVANPCI